MNLKSLFLSFTLLLSVNLSSQCYKIEADFGGMNNSSYQSALEAAACELRDSFPSIHQDDFNVFDFGFYSMNQYMQGGFEAVWEKVKTNVAVKSKYYLLFGKITNNKGVYTELWVDLVLPRDNSFTCIDLLSPNLRENLRKKYETIANEVHESNSKDPHQYHLAEISIMKQLSAYVGGLKQCCDFNKRNADQCSSCVLSNAQFEKTVDKAGLLGASVSKVIDNTHLGMGVEEIGYTIESGDLSINLDQAILDFKAQVHTKFPGVSIKTYPFNFQDGCDNFENIYSNFKTTNADIGIVVGVTGVNGQAGNLWWQMISKDDDPITPPSYSGNLDSIYFFNKGFYKGKVSTLAGARPKGVVQNNSIPPTSVSYYKIDNKDLQFLFADSDNTPLTLTVQELEEGELENHPTINEPLLNKAIFMTKEMILAQLAEEVDDPYGYPGQKKNGAFDEHTSSIWALLNESSGRRAPFDYAIKTFFIKKMNYLFITSDGENTIGHNFLNMGNFLWGAATYTLGIPQWLALSGAHLNNVLTEGLPFSDSADDQYSIKLGRHYAKIMKWKDLAGKGNKNILK